MYIIVRPTQVLLSSWQEGIFHIGFRHHSHPAPAQKNQFFI